MPRKHRPPWKLSKKGRAARASWEIRRNQIALNVSNSSSVRPTDPNSSANLDDSEAAFNSLLNESTATSSNKTSQSIAR